MLVAVGIEEILQRLASMAVIPTRGMMMKGGRYGWRSLVRDSHLKLSHHLGNIIQTFKDDIIQEIPWPTIFS